MRRSTLFLGVSMVVLAAVLAGLWQTFGPRAVPPTAQVVPSPAAPAPPRREARRDPPPPLQAPGEARAIEPPADPPEIEAPQTVPVESMFGTSAPTATLPPVGSAPPAPPDPVGTLPPPAQPERSAALRPPSAGTTETAPAAPGEALDINTASAEAFNALGAGRLGRAIVANRPYTAPDDLVTRKIIKRKDYEAIRGRITVH